MLEGVKVLSFTHYLQGRQQHRHWRIWEPMW